MLQSAFVVVQAEQQRAYGIVVTGFVPAKAGNHAVAFAVVLHLQHHALVRLVAALGRLGHHAVEPRAFEALEPIRRDGTVSRARGEVQRRLRLAEQRFQPAATLEERLGAQIALALAQQVEEHHGRGDLLRQELHARCRGVHAQLQRVEVECAALGHHDLTVAHALLGQAGLQRLEQLRKVAIQ